MTTKPVAVDKGASLHDVARLMARHSVGALLVKKDNIPVSIITEQDIVRKLLAKNINPLEKKVDDLEEQKLITISPGEDIYDALLLMRDHHIRHLPVLEKGALIGLLTLKDILKIEPALFDLLVDKYELKEEERKLSSISRDAEEDMLPAEKIGSRPPSFLSS